MSEKTSDINRVTTAVITVSWKLIACALVILLCYEAVTRGYEFGYGLFHDTAAAEAPGMDMKVTINEGETLGNLAAAMEKSGLVKNPVKAGTYLLNTSMPAKEIIITLREGKVMETDSEEESSEE